MSPNSVLAVVVVIVFLAFAAMVTMQLRSDLRELSPTGELVVDPFKGLAGVWVWIAAAFLITMAIVGLAYFAAGGAA